MVIKASSEWCIVAMVYKYVQLQTETNLKQPPLIFSVTGWKRVTKYRTYPLLRTLERIYCVLETLAEWSKYLCVLV